MIFESYFLGCLSHASYLVGDERSGRVAVVDPQRDVQQYVADAKRLGVKIDWVLLTHFHADFVAGHLELRETCGARIALGKAAIAAYPFVPLAEGDEIELGPNVRLRALQTPGHTPEGITLLVFDRDKSAEKPWCALTGDTLFIGDVGRPDLMASAGVTAEELAGQLYESVHGKLLKLPDETLVYPAHGAGSMCGKALADERVSTIGDQKRTNPALQPMSRAQFVAMATSELPLAPAYFAYDAAVNREEHATLQATLRGALKALPIAEVLRLRDAGAQVLDARDAAAFEAGHLRGSINVGLSGKYATWAGSVLARERPIVLIAPPGREEEAAMRLGRIGFDDVAGFLQGGPASIPPSELRRTPRVDAAELQRLLASPQPPKVLDVRNPSERAQRHIEGSLHVPLGELPKRLAEIPRDAPLVVHCGSGYRSAVACSLLEREGYDPTDFPAGIAGWPPA